jgi:hypothetical protein
MRAILQETIRAFSAQGLYAQLQKLDPAFLQAAKIIDCDVDYVEVRQLGDWNTATEIILTLQLEAELDASP